MREILARRIRQPTCLVVITFLLVLPTAVAQSSQIHVAGYIQKDPDGWVLSEETCKSLRPARIFLLDPEQAELWREFADSSTRIAIIEGNLEEIGGTSYLQADQASEVAREDFCTANPVGSVDIFMKHTRTSLGPGGSAVFEIDLQSRSETPMQVATTVRESSLPLGSRYQISKPSLQLPPNESETLFVQILFGDSTPGLGNYGIMIRMEFNSTKTQWDTYLLPALDISSQQVPEFAQNVWPLLVLAVSAAFIAGSLTRKKPLETQNSEYARTQ